MMSDNALLQRLATNVRVAMEGREYTQQQLAAAAGVPLMTVNRLLHGRNMPLLGVAVRVAAALECTVDDLLSPPRKRRRKKSA